MNANGSNNVRLTNNSVLDGWPSWSSSGAHTVCVSAGPSLELYRMDANGGSVTQPTNSSWRDDTPRYSPDGSKIILITGRDGQAEVYVMQADGSRQTRLTITTVGASLFPYWSPDRQPGAQPVFHHAISAR